MAAMKKSIIPVGGMSCQHCVSTVKSALEKMPGVTLVDVDLKRGEATVSGDSYDVAALQAAIEDLGYDAGTAREG